MIINYTASLDSNGNSRIQSYNSKSISQFTSAKETSLVNLVTSAIPKDQKSKTIKKELALKILKGQSTLTSSRTELGYSSPIGPGYYNYSTSSLSTQSFKFSSTSRIPSEPAASALSSIISMNKNVNQYIPEIKNREFKIRTSEKKERIANVQKNKKTILKEKKKKLQEKLEEKNKKSLRAKLKGLFLGVELGWIVFACLYGTSNLIFLNICNKKKIHKRAKKLLGVFVVVTKILAVCLGIVWKYRRAKANKKLVKLVGVTKMWVMKRRARYKVITLNLIETFTNKDKITKLMYKWKVAITTIQRKFRQILLQNKITNSVRLLSWGIAENKVSGHRKSKAIIKIQTSLLAKRHSRLSLKDKSLFSFFIPQEVKNFYIKLFFKTRVKEFINSLHAHKIRCRILIEEFKKNWFLREAAMARGEITSNELVLPPVPKPNYDLNENEMVKLVKKALENVESWEQLIKDSSKVKKNKKPRFSLF